MDLCITFYLMLGDLFYTDCTFCCGLETCNGRVEACSTQETYTVHGFMIVCILFIVPHNVNFLTLGVNNSFPFVSTWNGTHI